MKAKIKSFLNKVPFKKVTIVLIVGWVISIIIGLFVNANLGILFLSISFLVSMFFFVLATLKNIIDDINKIAGILLIIGWIIMIVFNYGKGMIKYIPKYFPNNTNEIYQLFISTFTTTISSAFGILGTYFGAIYGGKKSIEAVERQINKQEAENKKKEEENKKNVIRIITKFLKEEIIDNKLVIENTKIYEALEKGFGTQYGHDLSSKMKFNSYERIKYELIKYVDVELVEEVIDIYEMFYLLNRYSDINQLDKRDYGRLLNLKGKIESFLNHIT